MDQWMIVRRSQ